MCLSFFFSVPIFLNMSTFIFFLRSQLRLPTPAPCSRFLFGLSRNLMVTANSVIYEMNLPFSQVAEVPTLEPQDDLTILCYFQVPFLKPFTSRCPVCSVYESCAALDPAPGSTSPGWICYVAMTESCFQSVATHYVSCLHGLRGCSPSILFLTDTNLKVYWVENIQTRESTILEFILSILIKPAL